ncbi:MAG: hypothetical protein QXW84_08010 [Archaeoglobaceae archaeon]
MFISILIALLGTLVFYLFRKIDEIKNKIEFLSSEISYMKGLIEGFVKGGGKVAP